MALVLTQFALRFAPPWRIAATSVPSAALLFWLMSSFMLDWSRASIAGGLVFAAIGVLYPAAVTLLSFEANRRMGPNVAGAIGNVSPLFAVFFAVLVLAEPLNLPQAVGVAVIVAGVTLLSLDRRRAASSWPLWVLIIPFAAAAIRGAAPAAVKLGLAEWPDPLAVVLIGYTVSAFILRGSALWRSGGRLPPVGARATAWFVVLGLCNGLSMLLLYAALARGTVTLIAPLFAVYPLVTLALSWVLLRQERLTATLAAGVAATVLGVVLLIVGLPR